LFGFLVFLPSMAAAAPTALTYRYQQSEESDQLPLVRELPPSLL
jgi:hypothetical protein